MMGLALKRLDETVFASDDWGQLPVRVQKAMREARAALGDAFDTGWTADRIPGGARLLASQAVSYQAGRSTQPKKRTTRERRR